MLPLLIGLLSTVAAPPADGPAPLFPFTVPFDATPGSVADMTGLLDAPAGKHGPVTVRDGHLSVGSKRLRLFGVNLCFGANFPSRDDAPKIAARLARLGVNAVRFHHMDMFTAPNGIFAADGLSLDPERLDRLDYLIAELKQRGIYVDLNLHVSRTYPGMPKWDGMPSFHKGVDNFVPQMIEFQKRYAEDLLTHVNPYTRARYADEPAVAIVEINNENALWQDWFGGRLDAMPDAYQRALARLWNEWLKGKYRTTAGLRRGWSGGFQSIGPEMLRNGRFAQGMANWTLETHGEAKATVRREAEGPMLRGSARVAITAPGAEAWHVQFVQSGLKLAADRSYTLQFWARSDAPRKVTVAASQAHPPWNVLWSAEVAVEPRWAVHVLTFRPSQADEDARISFSGLAAATGEVGIGEVTLNRAQTVALAKDEVLGAIPPFTRADAALRTDEARRDWARFLLDTEAEYWTGMAEFLKAKLGVKAPIVGTQMGWSPFPVQAKLDVIDSHAYWEHPQFPGGDWDPVNWTVKNHPMTASPDGGTLPGLALSRVAGKPFLCTEYNHSAPNTYAAETFPLISGFAGAQDWDGVFAFAYSHRGGPPETDHFASFFDVDAHPVKLVTMPAAFAAFVRGDVPPFPQAITAAPTPGDVLEATVRNGPYVSAGRFGVSKDEALSRRVGVVEGKGGRIESGDPGPAPFSWKEGRAIVNSPRSRAFAGATGSGPVDLGDVSIRFGPTRQDWAALTITAIDGHDLRSPGRVLITATGYVENTDMGWKSPEKATVGEDWGKGPTLVEGIPARIVLPVPASRLKAWALDERGMRREGIPIAAEGDGAALEIGPARRTLWYEAEIRP